MQRMASLVFVVAMGVVSVSELRAEDDAFQKAMKSVNGTWKTVSQVIDGVTVSEQDLTERVLELKDGRWTAIKDGEVVVTGTYKLVGLEKNFMQYDVTVDTEEHKGKVYADITKLAGDVLTICIASEDKERPTAFESKPGSGCKLTVYKRKDR